MRLTRLFGLVVVGWAGLGWVLAVAAETKSRLEPGRSFRDGGAMKDAEGLGGDCRALMLLGDWLQRGSQFVLVDR